MRKDVPVPAVRDGHERPNATHFLLTRTAKLEDGRCWQECVTTQPSPAAGVGVGGEMGTALSETVWQVLKGFNIIIIRPGKQTPRYTTENQEKDTATQNLHTDFTAAVLLKATKAATSQVFTN